MVELVDSEDLGSSAERRVGSSPTTRTTSEQSPLCSDVFLCLWQKRRHPPASLLLLSKSQPLTLGCDLVLGKNLKAGASILLRCSTSEQSPLCSDVFLCPWQKRRHPPAPLLLLSKSNPLRWASIWYWVQIRKSRHLYCFDVPQAPACRRIVWSGGAATPPVTDLSGGNHPMADTLQDLYGLTYSSSFQIQGLQEEDVNLVLPPRPQRSGHGIRHRHRRHRPHP